MNLHGIVRGAITTVNPDLLVPYYRSAGYGKDSTFAQTPQYAAPVNVPIQVQALTGRWLQHRDLLDIQGVLRSVHMYGNTQGIVRADKKGGDLLYFPQVPGGQSYFWKVAAVLETWPDWCHLAVVMQTFTVLPT